MLLAGFAILYSELTAMKKHNDIGAGQTDPDETILRDIAGLFERRSFED